MNRKDNREWIEKNLEKLRPVKDYINYLYQDSLLALVDGAGTESLFIEKGKARAYKGLVRELTRIDDLAKGE